jgi:hypothetical protein
VPPRSGRVARTPLGTRLGIVLGGIVLGLLVAFGLLALAITALPFENLAPLLGVAMFLLVVVGFAGGAIALGFWSETFGTECPRCGRRWAAVFLGEHIDEEKECYGLVTRYALSRGVTTWKERVPVIRTTYLQHFACKYCAARWTGTRVQQVEDFDIPR